DVGGRGSEDDRIDLSLGYLLLESPEEFIIGKAACLEELLHQFLVALGNGFDELFAITLRPACKVAGGIRFRELRGPVAGVRVALVGNDIDNTLETFLLPNRNLNRHAHPTQHLLDGVQGTLETRSVLVHPIYNHQTGKLKF